MLSCINNEKKWLAIVNAIYYINNLKCNIKKYYTKSMTSDIANLTTGDRKKGHWHMWEKNVQMSFQILNAINDMNILKWMKYKQLKKMKNEDYSFIY